MSENEIAIRERRLLITMSTVDSDNFMPISGGDVSQVNSVKLSFALNGIPSADIELPRGISLDINRAGIIDKIEKIQTDRTLVGLFLEITQSRTSDTNNDEVQYWINTRGDTPDDYGQYRKYSVPIFVGYITAITPRESGSTATLSVKLAHWLSDLNRLSLFVPGSCTMNASDWSLALFKPYTPPGQSTGANNPPVWLPFNKLSNIGNITNLWYDVLKLFYDEILNEETQTSIYFPSVSNDWKTKIQKAIGRIRGAKELGFTKSIIAQSMAPLSQSIATALRSFSKLNYTAMTAWQALIQQLAPMFLFSVVPGVNKVTLIPAPGVLNSEDCEEITRNEIFEIMRTSVEDPCLGGVACVIPSKDTNNVQGDTAAYVKPACVYPDCSADTSLTGPILFVTLPDWLSTSQSLTGIPAISISYSEAKQEEANEGAKEKEIKIREAEDTVMRRYIQHAYLTAAFNGRVLSVTTPFRMDICPGAMVKITLEASKTEKQSAKTYYGIVSSVTAMVSSSGAGTTFTLFNLRNQEEYEDEVKTAKTSIFYDEAWSGQGVTLYEW